MGVFTEERKAQALEVIKAELTEERSDVLKRWLRDRIKSRLPTWLRWLPVGRILDEMLPEIIIELFEWALKPDEA